MAAPTFVAANTTIVSDITDPYSIDLTFPTGTTTGDIVFALLLTGGNSATYTVPGSFTSISKVSGANLVAELFWDRVEAGDDTTPTFSSTNSQFHGVLITYRGALATGTPYEDATYTAQELLYTQVTQVVTPTVDDTLALAFNFIEDNTGWATAPPPEGWTARMDISTGAGTDARFVIIERDSSPTKNVDLASVDIGTLGSWEYCTTTTLLLKPIASTALGPVIIGTDKIGLTYMLA